ncbi:MAG TPA: IgGFc-binding protein [Nannocystaceae bacterium]|nr:IgGFc-binding protein [Nannocystaceae bacterium]
MPRSHLVGAVVALTCGCVLEKNPDFDGPPPTSDSATTALETTTTGQTATSTASTVTTTTATTTSGATVSSDPTDPTLPVTTGDPCSEGDIQCADPATAIHCIGGMWVESPCEGTCEPGVGCPGCDPGSTTCVGEDLFVCDPQGFLQFVETCASEFGLACDPGFAACMGPCSPTELGMEAAHDLGCDFYATALTNAAVGADFEVLVVGAPGTKVSSFVGDVQETAGTIPADGALLVELIGAKPLGEGLKSAKVVGGAHRIRTDKPARVVQFNSLGAAASRDATALLPTHRWTYLTTVASMGSKVGVLTRQGFFAVIARTDGTKVVVTPPGNAKIAVSPVDGLGADGSGQLVLDAGDVVQVLADGTSDPTGIVLSATEPIQVLGGHRCAELPNTGQIVDCDHLETTVLAPEYGGQLFILAPPIKDDGYTPRAYIARILAPESAFVTVQAGQVFKQVTIPKGEYYDVSTDAPTRITSDKPVMVAQYGTGLLIGQESMTWIPAQNHLPTVVDLAMPPGNEKSAVTLAWLDAEPTLDGVPVGDYAYDNFTGISSIRLSLDNKRHSIKAGPNDRVSVVSEVVTPAWSLRTFHGLE